MADPVADMGADIRTGKPASTCEPSRAWGGGRLPREKTFEDGFNIIILPWFRK
jgi:hypothetical protein